MNKETAALVVMCVGTALAAVGCPGPPEDPSAKPDLIPLPVINGFDPPSFDFCVRENGKLVVTVRNQGTGDAGMSSTRVTWETPLGTANLGTVSIPNGEERKVTAEIPAGCFDADCTFTINVDQGNLVDESNETNNQVEATCIG